MATKKKATKKSTSETRGDGSSIETARRQALEHEKAGRWSQAAEGWASVERLAGPRKVREEAAGRKAAAQVRARAQVSEEMMSESPKAAGPSEPAPDESPVGGSADRPAGEEAAPADYVDPEFAKALDARKARKPISDPRLPPVGTVILKKDRQGQERARCTMVEGGVEYRGEVYKSISAAAMAAAKDLGLASKTQDGYAFWGLKKAAPRERDPVAALQAAWERYRDRATSAAQTESEDRAKVQAALHEHATALLALAGDVAA